MTPFTLPLLCFLVWWPNLLSRCMHFFPGATSDSLNAGSHRRPRKWKGIRSSNWVTIQTVRTWGRVIHTPHHTDFLCLKIWAVKETVFGDNIESVSPLIVWREMAPPPSMRASNKNVSDTVNVPPYPPPFQRSLLPSSLSNSCTQTIKFAFQVITQDQAAGFSEYDAVLE
ncbi:hypothetical protein P691DRAFT_789025 [Macrolepiota fuliginosa MF-IS2]|uniref:Secreted protein n=1 Tax=Macrolepiota fuliginosa MF-IS2 TaxID=1400762 RepID=A0A9P5X3L2_9AGAR|nr:hypothetical protein P691DRAFT_789025 [Macrolepiota fuliginosa MF-IS2]